jgi:hypothetical protein
MSHRYKQVRNRLVTTKRKLIVYRPVRWVRNRLVTTKRKLIVYRPVRRVQSHHRPFAASIRIRSYPSFRNRMDVKTSRRDETASYIQPVPYVWILDNVNHSPHGMKPPRTSNPFYRGNLTQWKPIAIAMPNRPVSLGRSRVGDENILTGRNRTVLGNNNRMEFDH